MTEPVRGSSDTGTGKLCIQIGGVWLNKLRRAESHHEDLQLVDLLGVFSRICDALIEIQPGEEKRLGVGGMDYEHSYFHFVLKKDDLLVRYSLRKDLQNREKWGDRWEVDGNQRSFRCSFKAFCEEFFEASEDLINKIQSAQVTLNDRYSAKLASQLEQLRIRFRGY